MLQINHVSKQYAGHKALDDISLHVPAHGIYGLLGPNGAGKTTLIRIINTITGPDSGEVLLHGRPIAPADALRIGYLPEERGLYRKMKVGEQALFLARLKGMSRTDALKALKFWFEKFEIQSWWNKKVEELSKGMAQKVQFITTVLHEPELLILDEPFSGFDPVNTELIKNEILALRDKGTTIILSTHNMASVEELCENISLINRSRIVLQGHVEAIRTAHATNTFLLRTSDTLAADSLAGCTISTRPRTGSNQLNEYIIGKPEAMSNNDLLRLLLHTCSITSFEEVLPTMNEIFIKTVSK